MTVRACHSRLGLLLVLTLQAPIAAACGHCVEDKMAAVYDHAVITRALLSHQEVAFFSINGDVPANEASKKALEAIAEMAPGVTKHTVKVALDVGALALVFNPKVQDIASLQKNIEGKWRGKRLGLTLIKVMSASEKTFQWKP